MKNKKVTCFGEVLWDSLPKGLYLGGAPLNVALNLNNLGIDTTMISAVGNDKLGKLAVQSIREKGLDTGFIQFNDYPTGVVDVEIDNKGDADYTINEPSAWDYIEYNNELKDEIDKSNFVVFGTLIFRNANSRSTLNKALSKFKGKVIVDVNFRKPFYDKTLVNEVLNLADIVKVNHEEIDIILKWNNKSNLNSKEALSYLCKQYNLEMILLTRGEEGSILYHNGDIFKKERFEVNVKDTVGTGDAFLAGSIYSLLKGEDNLKVISFANALGAFVASRNGATPEINMEKIEFMLGAID